MNPSPFSPPIPRMTNVIFPSCRYLDIVDYLISSYRLQPSTEFGNWGLNDYRHVAFVWGSAQLAAGDGPSPAACVLDETAASRHRDAFVFAKCMDAVHRRANGGYGSDEPVENGGGGGPDGRKRRQRTPPVWSHSYQLWNVTGLTRWDRVNECLTNAFRRDVLGRFEIVSRLAFGELLKFAPNPRPPDVPFYDCVPAPATTESSAFDRARGYGDDKTLGAELFGTELLSHEAIEEFE